MLVPVVGGGGLYNMICRLAKDHFNFFVPVVPFPFCHRPAHFIPVFCLQTAVLTWVIFYSNFNQQTYFFSFRGFCLNSFSKMTCLVVWKETSTTAAYIIVVRKS